MARPGTEAQQSEQKRKFREALERKKGTPVANTGARGDSKVHSAHGPATTGTMFRRKSV